MKHESEIQKSALKTVIAKTAKKQKEFLKQSSKFSCGLKEAI